MDKTFQTKKTPDKTPQTKTLRTKKTPCKDMHTCMYACTTKNRGSEMCDVLYGGSGDV